MIPFFDHTPAAPKICGITTPDDALGCIEAGAGALGFNFYPLSPRSIPVNGDLSWIAKLKADYPDIALVAVVVNPDAELLQKLREARCFDAIQFHGDESPESCATEGAAFNFWIKALRIRREADLASAPSYQTPFLLLDAAVPGSYGGSGKTTDWSLASKFISENPKRRVLLAGGLTPENVAGAVQSVFPHAVDVASGVEVAPGRKDPVKVREFIAAALAI
ncbi:MAG: phosphoribosylanthranilate isomerase [bacterium]